MEVRGKGELYRARRAAASSSNVTRWTGLSLSPEMPTHLTLVQRIAFHDHFRRAFEKRPRGIVPARHQRRDFLRLELSGLEKREQPRQIGAWMRDADMQRRAVRKHLHQRQRGVAREIKTDTG